MAYLKPFLRRAARRRPITEDNEGSKVTDETFKKCLTTFDLVSLGVGSCCGAGMYLTVGLVSYGTGLGASFSFILAGIGSLLSGLCYAELAALCPRTSGSAYMYSYVTVGELVAFVIGWGLLVEYAIGTAASAVALSAAIDTVTSFSYSKSMTLLTGTFLGRAYFDVISVVICLTLTVILSAGVELSATFNHILNFINLAVFLFFVGCSIFLAKTSLFTNNGFFPKGIMAAVMETPKAYFAFIGFDIVASTGEEAKNPSKSIPRSIWISILINTVVYVTITICINLVLPYTDLHNNSAMIYMFGAVGWTNAKFIVSVGAICALFAATFGSLFPLPRVLFAMAKDGLIFRRLGHICPKRKTPKLATIISGCIAAVLAVSVNLGILIELVLLGTLLAYVLVAVCVLITRYSFEEKSYPTPSKGDSIEEKLDNNKNDLPPYLDFQETTKCSNISTTSKLMKLLKRSPTPGETLSKTELVCVLCLLLVSEVLVCMLLELRETTLVTFISGHVGIVCCLTPFLLIIVIVLFILIRLPQNTQTSGFRVPAVPLLPVVVTFFNLYLMISLTGFTWSLFAGWLLIGFVVYVYMSYRNEKQEKMVTNSITSIVSS